MTGPGKRDDELRAAVRAGIRAVTVESLGELGRLERVARNEDRRQPVLLRAAVTEGARLERVRLVGDDGAGKFGMDAADLVDAARLAARSEHLELLGLHAFGASNVLDASALVAHAATTARAARELARLSGTTVRIVDAGGGLGIPYEPHEESLDLVGLGRGLAAHRRRLAGRPAARRGAPAAGARALPGRAGRRLPRLGGGHQDRRWDVGRDPRWRRPSRPSTGAGRHGASGPAASPSTRRPIPVTVAGPLCSGLDVLATGAAMAPPSVGDLMAVLDVGAYGFTESMPYFLSHPIPAEVVARDGRAELIRPRLEPATWLDAQLVPDLVAPGPQ